MITLSPSRRKLFLAICLLTVFGIGIGAGLLEVTVRWFFPMSDFLWQWDPVVGLKLTPGKRGRSVKAGVFDVPVEINSVGFRDREHAIDKPAGTRRIVLLGDSFLEAIQVPFERSVTPLLEDRLQKTGSRTELISFGVSGTGTARQYLALREYGLQYKPDLVILFFVGNDISDNSQRLQGLPYVPYPRTTPDGGLARDEFGLPLFTQFSDQSSQFSFITDQLKERWKSYRFIREMIDSSPGFNRLLYRLKLMSTPPEAVNAPAGDNFGFYEIYRLPPRPVWAEAWRVTEDLMLAVRDLAKSNDAKFGVVLIPAAWEVDPHAWEEVLARMPTMREVAIDLDQPSTRLSQFLTSHGIPVMNLLPDFRSRIATSPPLYLRGDAHWTAEGHQLATDIIAGPVEAMLGHSDQQLTSVLTGRGDH